MLTMGLLMPIFEMLNTTILHGSQIYDQYYFVQIIRFSYRESNFPKKK